MTLRTVVAMIAAALALSATSACGADEAGAGGSLEVWTMGDKGKAMTDLAAEFTKETGIGVDVQSIPWKNARDKMSTAIASGDGPDVVQVGLSFLAEFADAGALLDLSAKLSAYPDLDPAKFFPASAETMKVADKTVGVPWISDTRVMFYRTDVLQASGYSKAPATWEELTAAATKLTARGDGNFGFGINTDDQFLPIILTWAAGGEVGGAGGGINFDTPEFRRALEYERSFFTGGLTPKKAQPDPDMVQGFKTGKIPMFMSGPYMATLLEKQAPELNGKWAVAPMPKDKSSTSLMAGSNLSVFHKSARTDDAMKFIAFLARKETQERWYKATNDLPARQDALEALRGAGDRNLAVYYDQMTNAKIVPQVKAWGAVAPEMVRAVQTACIGNGSVDDALKAFNAKVAQLTTK
ncbi:extracellular solute-binding protein [Dactylosporangium sp. CA-152071]|uniref:extracellular solute-binding protein n=1 Tax=Dactylosporangium sp. CA-152071 TaxID=3239933 RepID=UPI003D8E9580